MTRCYGGIDLGGSYIKAGLLSENGEIIEKTVVPAEVDRGTSSLIKNLRSIGKILSESAASNACELRAIGVGSPGTIKFPEGIVTGATPNIPNWVGINISEIFTDFPFPVLADNDANCMGLAEAMFGAGRGTANGFYLTVGTGIGGALIIDGHVHRGASFCAGEFGHMVFVYNGVKCKTGRLGCLEHYVNAAGLIRSARKYARKYSGSVLRGHKLDVVEIFDAFNKGDSAAAAAVGENAEMLGTAIGSVVNLLNPEVVVVGGGMSQGGAGYIDLIRSSVLKYAFESTTLNLKIEAAKFGNDAGWIGAACLNIG